jgi:GTP-binding protein
LTQEIMRQVELRREMLIASGEEVSSRETSGALTSQQRSKRRPPHLAGPTAALSDEMQAKDYQIDSVEATHAEEST